MSLLKVAQWNYDRNGLEYSPELEHLLWAEEVHEFKNELVAYLANPLNKLEVVANMLKEYCDCIFVYSGSLAKQLGNTAVENKQNELNIMNSYLTEILMKHRVKIYREDEQSLIDLAMEAVMIANEAKPKTKTKAKVAKGKDYISPQTLIIEMLLDRGFEEYPEVIKEEEEVVNAD